MGRPCVGARQGFAAPRSPRPPMVPAMETSVSSLLWLLVCWVGIRRWQCALDILGRPGGPRSLLVVALLPAATESVREGSMEAPGLAARDVPYPLYRIPYTPCFGCSNRVASLLVFCSTTAKRFRGTLHDTQAIGETCQRAYHSLSLSQLGARCVFHKLHRGLEFRLRALYSRLMIFVGYPIQ